MSWEEMYKFVNRNLQEPLSFNNYINDISTFHADSYVLDVENEELWRQLLQDSLTMFGHRAIHATVYNRMTAEDIDFMLRNNGRIGESFNSFYRTNVFQAGDIDTVLGSLTDAAYEQLEPKIQSGIYRYISEKTAGGGAGSWLGTVFNLDSLKAKGNIASIVSDTNLWTSTIMRNESLRRVISISESTVQYFSANPSSVYVDFIREVCSNTDATMLLLDSLSVVNGLTDFMNTQEVVTAIANKRESMVAVVYRVEAFAAMLNSSVAMNTVAASDIAMGVLLEGFENVASSESPLTNIKAHLNRIQSELGSIPDSAESISVVENTVVAVQECIDSINTVNSKADALAVNMNALVNNATAMTALAASATAMTALAANATAMSAILNSATATNVILNSATAMNALLNNATAINALLNSETVMTTISKNREAFVSVLNSSNSFTKTSVSLGNGVGSWNHGLNTNTIYVPVSCFDDNDTDYYVYGGINDTVLCSSIGRHSGTVSVTQGVSFRGVYLVGQGSSAGYVTFDVYTLK